MLLLLLAACTENQLHAKGDPNLEPSAPDIAVEPAAIDFGSVAPGGSADAVLTIRNQGEAALNLDPLALVDGAAGVTWTGLGDGAVPPGGALEAVLTWAPADGEGLSGALEVPSDDPDEPVVAVSLLGSSALTGDIRVEPPEWDFGSLALGQAAIATVTVSNEGAGPLAISGWSYEATDADLSVVDAGALGEGEVALAPGESTEIRIKYAPTAGGADEGTLTVASDDPDSPAIEARQWGAGSDPCDGFTQTVTLQLTADDAWQAWIDGASFTAPNANNWSVYDTMEWEMPCGDHALAIYATDTAQSVSGVIAVVWVEGVVRFISGPSNWKMIETSPPAGWTDPAFDDAGWHTPEVCASTAAWGSSPQSFYDLGAQWIWWSSDCSSLGEAWLRLNFTVP